MFLPARNSPFKCSYLLRTAPLNVPIYHNSPFKCSYLPGTVPLLFLPARNSPFKCSYLLGTGRNRRRKQRRKRTGQCAADPKSTNQSINQSIKKSIINQIKEIPFLGQSIKKIFIKNWTRILFKPIHKKMFLNSFF